MNTPANRDGFALPMAILVIGFMTAGVVASFTRVGAEIQIVDNQRGQTAAFAMAEAGLSDFLVSGRLPPGVNTRTQTFNYPGGSAVVTAQRIRQQQGFSVVLVSSVGSATSGAGRPPSTRTVAQFGVQQPMQMQVMSSWTSLSGVHKNGNSGWFGGEDAAGETCGDGVTRAGIAVPDGLATGPHINERVSGEPPVDQMGSVEEMAEALEIDWLGITNPVNPSIMASPGNVVCRPGTYGWQATYGPCGSWPTNFEHWPTVVINGSMTLPSSGRGVLIVTGNLTLIGNQDWQGVILVGGKIVDNGQGVIDGSVISGLNVLKGETVGESEIEISEANGQKRYQFDSCAVQDALSGATSGIRPIPNAWVDNWATW